MENTITTIESSKNSIKNSVKTSVRFVFISDTHEKHNSLVIPNGDVLIHTGDFTNYGEVGAVRKFNSWLGKLPHPEKIVIAGNHDITFDEPHFYKQPYMPTLLTNAIYLQDRSINIHGYNIYGTPWVPIHGTPGFSLKPEELEKKWAAIPNNTDILLTHCPPGGILDTHREEHLGCKLLRKRIEELNISLHAFGHIHTGYGKESINGIQFINSSSCNARHQPINKPFVVDLPILPKE